LVRFDCFGNVVAHKRELRVTKLGANDDEHVVALGLGELTDQPDRSRITPLGVVNYHADGRELSHLLEQRTD